MSWARTDGPLINGQFFHEPMKIGGTYQVSTYFWPMFQAYVSGNLLTKYDQTCGKHCRPNPSVGSKASFPNWCSTGVHPCLPSARLDPCCAAGVSWLLARHGRKLQVWRGAKARNVNGRKDGTTTGTQVSVNHEDLNQRPKPIDDGLFTGESSPFYGRSIQVSDLF